jgi:hypothetical protein
MAGSTNRKMDVAESRAASYVCKVESTGAAEDDKVYVFLTDMGGEFTDRWFSAKASVKKEMLATALTALTSGLNVHAYLTSSDQGSEILRLYIR